MIVLITPTGARPEQFKLCSLLMNRQTFQGKVKWIIVDDAIPVSSDFKINFRKDWEVVRLYPTPSWKVGDNTQARNLGIAIEYITKTHNQEVIQGIFIIEDDDYYSAGYLEQMVSRLQSYDIIGEITTIYYNVVNRTYSINKNIHHSSLFQTAFTPKMVDIFLKAFSEKYIDIKLWATASNKLLFKDKNLSIGIKGLPGRAGIGAGHGQGMIPDPQMNFFKIFIDKGDEVFYEYFYVSKEKLIENPIPKIVTAIRSSATMPALVKPIKRR